ncbi:uncharacterized protein LOC142786862 [Rhipicephalus microplus]|uniref:uncharacterized protein LOC142786862 n=1 Tax=Rhipicephalus microplus TaxID=6941 RepID=UPI003F6B79D2
MKETECQTDIGLSDVVAHLEQQRCSTPVTPVIPVTPATPVRSEPLLSYRDDPKDDTYEPLLNSSEALAGPSVQVFPWASRKVQSQGNFLYMRTPSWNSLRPTTFEGFLLRLQKSAMKLLEAAIWSWRGSREPLHYWTSMKWRWHSWSPIDIRR